MAVYYVRNDGSDANAGTGPGAASAWQTIGKALGATGIASGDTVWVAPGTYRELVSVNITAPTSATYIKGDPTASQFPGVSAGVVRITNYLSGDNAAPTAGVIIDLNTRNYMNFSGIFFDAGPTSGSTPAIAIANATTVSRFQTFTDCAFYIGANKMGIGNITYSANMPANFSFDMTLERCVSGGYGGLLQILCVNGTTGTDAPMNLYFNSVYTENFVYIQSSGANLGTISGPCQFTNSTFANANGGLTVGWTLTPTSTSNVYNCIFDSNGLTAGVTGHMIENWNYFSSGSNRTNVSSGANSKFGYADIELMQNRKFGIYSYMIGFLSAGSNAIGTGNTTYAPAGGDVFGKPYTVPPSMGSIEFTTLGAGGGLKTHNGMNGGMNG